jgi:hypothetical protein
MSGRDGASEKFPATATSRTLKTRERGQDPRSAMAEMGTLNGVLKLQNVKPALRIHASRAGARRREVFSEGACVNARSPDPEMTSAWMTTIGSQRRTPYLKLPVEKTFKGSGGRESLRRERASAMSWNRGRARLKSSSVGLSGRGESAVKTTTQSIAVGVSLGRMARVTS